MKQHRVFRNRKRMQSNKKGGIEGLPLQLLIVIVIASLGLAMMIGWMGNISEPDRIDEINTSYEKTAAGYEVTVRVVDQNGYGIEGADVVITGYGAYSFATPATATYATDESGNDLYIAEGLYVNGKLYNEPTQFTASALIANGYTPSNYERVEVPAQHTGGIGKTTPHGVTDEEGFATITIQIDNLKTYGTLNVEASKSGYSEASTTMKVFA